MHAGFCKNAFELTSSGFFGDAELLCNHFERFARSQSRREPRLGLAQGAKAGGSLAVRTRYSPFPVC
jgi:hypothetical protein